MNLIIKKTSLDNVINNVLDISHMFDTQEELLSILALERLANNKKLNMTELYQHELNLKNFKNGLPKKLTKAEEMYKEDILEVLGGISSVIKEIEEKR